MRSITKVLIFRRRASARARKCENGKLPPPQGSDITKIFQVWVPSLTHPAPAYPLPGCGMEPSTTNKGVGVSSPPPCAPNLNRPHRHDTMSRYSSTVQQCRNTLSARCRPTHTLEVRAARYSKTHQNSPKTRFHHPSAISYRKPHETHFYTPWNAEEHTMQRVATTAIRRARAHDPRIVPWVTHSILSGGESAAGLGISPLSLLESAQKEQVSYR